MSALLKTILLATALVVVAIFLLSIGKLITGKNKFSCKRCGNPEDHKKGCPLCNKDTNKKHPDPH